MADRYYASITIGGEFPAALLDELPSDLTGLKIETGGSDHRNYLEECAETGTNPTFYDEHANWGMFESLEDWLIEHDIDFNRTSGQFYGYSAETRHYRHNEDVDITVEHSEDKDSIVSARTMEEWVRLLKTGEIRPVIADIENYLHPASDLRQFVIVRKGEAAHG